jgi:sugar/nucleoside kinase (ribokinase family)
LLCCIGDLVEDVVVRVPTDIATGTDTAVSIVRRRGGSAANVAVCAASTGAAVRFIGRVGSDTIGAALVEELSASGVDACIQHQGRTGTIVVLVDARGERSMLPDRAAATDLEDIREDALTDVTWLHVPAYSLVVEPLATTTIGAIRRVQQTGAMVSIDASSVAIIDHMGVHRFKKMLADLGPDVVFCNEDEGATLGVASLEGLAGVELTVVKAGAVQAVAYRDEKLIAAASPPSLTDVRDTTGAGDAFAAGFILARMNSEDVTSALENGHRLAGQLLTNHSA